MKMLPVMTMVNVTDLPEFSREPMLKTDSCVLPLQFGVNLVTVHPSLVPYLAYLVSAKRKWRWGGQAISFTA